MKKIKALTFIEVMISLAIFSIIITFVYSIMASGRATWQTADTVIYVQQQARQALDYMAKELRQSSDLVISGVPADGANYTEITFQRCQGWNATSEAIDWSDQIVYGLNANNQIYRSSTDGEPPILANDIDSLVFRRQSATSNIVEVYITGSKTNVLNRNVEFSLASQVTLRN